MPYYTFVCNKCSLSDEKMLCMTDAGEPQLCPHCKIEMHRDYQADLAFAASKDYHKPLVSDSLAVNPNQIEEHKQMFPGIEMTSQGQPVFTNYRQHDDYLKKAGFIKRPQKIRPRGKKI